MLLNRRNMLLAMGGAAVATGLPRAFAADMMPATMAYGSTGYTWALAFTADGIDAWGNAGVDLNALDFPTGRESMQALLGGSADFATATDTPVTFAGLRGLKPIVLASYSRYSRDMKIAMKEGAADPSDPASLKGKTIATRVGTSGQRVAVSPQEADKIAGADIAGAANKDAICAAATSKAGDYLHLRYGGANCYLIVAQRGIWAFET